MNLQQQWDNFLERYLSNDFFDLFPDGIEDLEIIGDNIFYLGVPSRSSNDFKKNVFAAAKASTMGYRSIDYVLNQYGGEWRFKTKINKDFKLICDITDTVKQNVRETIEYIYSIDNKPDSYNLFASSAALIRLQNTFRSAIFAIKQGFHFESAGMERMILEQLAWIYFINKLNVDEKQFYKIKPSECVSLLKENFLYVGHLYGQLSDSGHITPRSTLRYIKLKDGKPIVCLTTPEDSKYDAFFLLLLCDIYVTLAELIYAAFVGKHEHVYKAADGQFKPKNNRPMKKIVKKYHSLVFSSASNKKCKKTTG